MTMKSGTRAMPNWGRTFAAVAVSIAAASSLLAVGFATPASAAPNVAWSQMSGSATDIATVPGLGVWEIGTDPRPGGFGVYRWMTPSNASHYWQWFPIPIPNGGGGGALRIAVGVSENNEIVTVSTASHAIWQLDFANGAWC